MGFDEERFGQFSRTQGRLSYEAAGKVDEIEYRSANSLNMAGTIGFSAVEVDGKVDHIFLSRTGKGTVLTMPGEETGPAPFPMEGYLAVSTVAAGSPIGAFYEAHLWALAKEAPLADRAWLEHEVPVLPQRALEVTMKMFQIVCDSMDGMMEGMGKAVGEAMEGVGKAVGEAMEGAGKAMGEMVRGAQSDGALPEKAEADDAPRKKSRPARKVKPAGTRRKSHPRGKKPK